MSTCWPARCPSQPTTASVSVTARGVSVRFASTCARRHAMRGTTSVAVIPLLTPGVAAVVVAEPLPEAGAVAAHDLDPAHPLRALPEVEVGDEEARGPTVLGLQRLAVEFVSDPC